MARLIDSVVLKNEGNGDLVPARSRVEKMRRITIAQTPPLPEAVLGAVAAAKEAEGVVDSRELARLSATANTAEESDVGGTADGEHV